MHLYKALLFLALLSLVRQSLGDKAADEDHAIVETNIIGRPKPEEKGVLDRLLVQVQGVSLDTCSLPADPGPCKAAIRRYYFDKFTETCTHFIYGGCRGNKNNFKTKKECEKRCGKPSCPCPKIKKPVCGVDDTTYANECLAKCAGVKVACEKECPCKEPCICPAVFDPVCGVNNVTYGNSCEARCVEVKVDCKGTCPCKPPCEKDIVDCVDDPCRTATCERFPDAKCVANFCGGCNAEFFVDGKKVDCNPRTCLEIGDQCGGFLGKKGVFTHRGKKCCRGSRCCICHPLARDIIQSVPIKGFCGTKCPVCKG